MNNTMLAVIVIGALVIGLGVLGVAGWNPRNSNGAAIPMPAVTAQGQAYYNAGPMSPMMVGYGPMGSMMHGGMMGGWGHCGGQMQTYAPVAPQQGETPK